MWDHSQIPIYWYIMYICVYWYAGRSRRCMYTKYLHVCRLVQGRLLFFCSPKVWLICECCCRSRLHFWVKRSESIRSMHGCYTLLVPTFKRVQAIIEAHSAGGVKIYWYTRYFLVLFFCFCNFRTFFLSGCLSRVPTALRFWWRSLWRGGRRLSTRSSGTASTTVSPSATWRYAIL